MAVLKMCWCLGEVRECVSVCACVPTYLCVAGHGGKGGMDRERYRERDRLSERQTDRVGERDREWGGGTEGEIKRERESIVSLPAPPW